MLKKRSPQHRPGWTGYYDRDCGTRLFKVAATNAPPVVDKNDDPLAWIDHFLVGLRSGRIEYAVLRLVRVGMERELHPVPWELLEANEAESGFTLLADAALLPGVPLAGPDWNYMACARIYNHFGLFY